jgi:HD-GYP domain-containing protein (c-di-GMP phosphodiesterase class II)
MTDERHHEAAESLLRRLAAAVKAVHLYSADHPIVGRTAAQLAEAVDQVLADRAEVVVGIVDGQLVVDGEAGFGGSGAADALDRLAATGIERLVISRGVTSQELGEFVRRLPAGAAARAAGDDQPAVEGTAHIRVSRLFAPRQADGGSSDMRAVRQAYTNAVVQVEQLWHGATADGQPDPALAAEVVEGLAELVGQSQQAAVALTALCHYDNYTFTHMVNVGVLTMAQARCLGIEGDTLRHFGLAGLMHDVGKIRTPPEILTKPGQLTDAEFVIMKKHPVDGADILRRQIEMPPLAAIVAFEHHLRVDGTGYPDGVRRPSLNVATQLCAIADVYDAMRSQRAYQQAFPTDRILGVLAQNDGTRFDQHLVRRFSQLMGIYPPGNVVRLDDGSLAVVLRTHAPEPASPAVRVVTAPDGTRLATPVDLALWDQAEDGPDVRRIVTPVDPATVGIDPLPFLQSAAA